MEGEDKQSLVEKVSTTPAAPARGFCKGVGMFKVMSIIILTVLLTVLIDSFIEQFYENKASYLKSALRISSVRESTKAEQSVKKPTFRFSVLEHILYPVVYNNDPIQKLPDNLKHYNFNSTTVISVYMELNKSKHSVKDYDQWMRHFASSMRSPLAMVVNRKAYEKLKPLTEKGTTKFYVVEDIYNILTQVEFERNMSYVWNYLTQQHALDGEKSIHNPNLYAVWNMKCYIAHKISEENPFNSSFFIFSDTGAFRGGPQYNWPDTEFISKQVVPKLKDRVLLGQVNPRESMDQLNYFNDIIQGTFFAGTAKALKNFYENYFKIHDTMFLNGDFVGKEQNLMNLVAFKHYNDTAVRLRAWHLNCTYGYDGWFFYQRYFSVNSTLHCTKFRERLLLEPGQIDVTDTI